LPIADLLALVEQLRSRIEDHGRALKQNEALTRYSLIDPLLRALGWDTEAPDIVVPEYNVGEGRADYALFHPLPEQMADGSRPVSSIRPTVIVEAKSLDTPLNEAAKKGIHYCLEQGIGHFAVTDGRRWEIYETYRQVPLNQKKIVSFDLKEASAAEVCRKALALWRAGAQSELGRTAERAVGPLPSPAPEPPPSPKPSPAPNGSWKAIANMSDAYLRTPGKPKPVEIRFPDETCKPLSRWKEIVVEVVRWLVEQNYLNEDMVPIAKAQGSKNYAVSAFPEHPTGTKFGDPVQVGPLYVETGSARTIIRGSKAIITSAGQDPSLFQVRFGD
jgi:hypothetical protein